MAFQDLAVGLVMLCLLSPLAWSSQDEAEGSQLYFLSVETAIANLEHEHPAVRASAAKSIGLLGAYGKIGPVEARMAAEALGGLLLDDEDLPVRRMAIGALGLMGAAAQAAVDDLGRVLREDDSAEIREAAASLLGDMGPGAQAAVEDLIGSLMNDADDAVRRQAALTLGAIGPAAGAAVDGLRSVLRKDPFIEIRITAAAALGNLGPAARAAVEDLRQVLRSEYDAQGYFLLSLDDKRYGSAYTPPFAPDYLHARLRHTALQSLGQIGPPAWTTAVSDLRKVILEDEAPEVRESAAGLLAKLGPAAQAAIDDLRHVLLNDKDAAVRAGAARALGRASGDAGSPSGCLARR